MWWWVLLAATSLNGAVVGYGAIWFQLFGDRPDRSDYLLSAGGYGAAAGVLLVASIGLVGLRGPRSAVPVSGFLALLLAAFAARSVSVAVGMPRERFEESPLDGAGGVLLMPWALALLVAGAVGAYHLLARGRGAGAPRGGPLERPGSSTGRISPRPCSSPWPTKGQGWQRAGRTPAAPAGPARW